MICGRGGGLSPFEFQSPFCRGRRCNLSEIEEVQLMDVSVPYLSGQALQCAYCHLLPVPAVVSVPYLSGQALQSP